jgi:TIP49 P-loop domain
MPIFPSRSRLIITINLLQTTRQRRISTDFWSPSIELLLYTTTTTSTMKIDVVSSSSNPSSSRISAHTHITGLGLDPATGDALQDDSNTSGLVGQTAAREALGIVSDLIHSQLLAGRALLLVGPPGTGKVRSFCKK